MNKNCKVILSVIIPTHNESRLGYLPKIFKSLQSLPNTEIICIDYASSDDTAQLINHARARLIHSEKPARSARLNEGLRRASGEILLFHHPRTVVDRSGYEYLIKNYAQLTWGGFQHQFDMRHPLLQFTSWYSNKIRSHTQKIIYLDHCIYAKRAILEQIDYPIWPEIEIFEDTEFCKKIRLTGPPLVLPFRATTSAIRFQQRGVYRQSLLNQILKLGYYWGLNHKLMNRQYEKGVELNLTFKDH